MIVFQQIPIWFVFKSNFWYILYIIGVALLTWIADQIIPFSNPTVLLPSLTVFGTVLSLFLAFRTNEAYNRWWEARTLWGAMVNDSRSFAREVFAFTGSKSTNLDKEELHKVRKKFIYRHLGYINSLRLHLRGQREMQSDELEKWVSPEEKKRYLQMANIPVQIVFQQSEELKETFRAQNIDSIEYTKIQDTLNRLYDVQGGCERIKNTVFPRMYSYYTTASTWIFSFVLIFSLADEFDFQTLMIRCLVAYVFIILNDLSATLKNPFENKPQDTPMTALCRTIEIDLRQMLDEKEVPKPLQPVHGILN